MSVSKMPKYKSTDRPRPMNDYTTDAEYSANLVEAEKALRRSRECGGIDDPRPSKLRDAMKRLGISRVADAKNGQQALVLDRAKAADGLAAINRRNKQVWDERTSQGIYYPPRGGVKP